MSGTCGSWRSNALSRQKQSDIGSSRLMHDRGKTPKFQLRNCRSIWTGEPGMPARFVIRRMKKTATRLIGKKLRVSQSRKLRSIMDLPEEGGDRDRGISRARMLPYLKSSCSTRTPMDVLSRSETEIWCFKSSRRKLIITWHLQKRTDWPWHFIWIVNSIDIPWSKRPCSWMSDQAMDGPTRRLIP